MLFVAFAFAYFLSAMLRAVTATLAPVFSAELALQASELGLLAGAYFLGFAVMQLPLGSALDRLGPRRVLLGLLVLAVIGCAAFASARSLIEMIVARTCIGVGVAACLMAPLTCYRRVYSAETQLRANSWMLMTGSFGMVVSTVPVQALLPYLGWRGVFWASAVALACAMVLVARVAPGDPAVPGRSGGVGGEAAPAGGYAAIVRHPLFLRMAPLGFFCYGGMIAVQALWAGPWLTRVAGWSSQEASQGLLAINLCMLLAFLGWGAVVPRLSRMGWRAQELIAWGLPASLAILALIVAAGPHATALHWTAWCVASTVGTLSQPAIGQAFALQQVGRALSAFNLVIFAGVFALQWGIGLVVDLLLARGLGAVDAFRAAFGVFLACCVAAYLWFLGFGRWDVDNRPRGD